MKKYHEFQTPRLILSPSSVKDAGFFLKLLNSPSWIEHIGDRNVKTLEDAENYINEKMAPQLERLGYSNYTIIRKEDGHKIGCCGLYDRDGVDGIDIGYALLPEYEKNGYAFEAASAMVEAAFRIFKIRDLKAITTEKNLASQKLLKKLGFIYVRHIHIPNDPEDLMLYKREGDRQKLKGER